MRLSFRGWFVMLITWEFYFGDVVMFVNGSKENGIDVLRGKIQDFASSVSFTGGRKYVLIDEADYLNAQSIQPALRSFMEQYSTN